MHRWSAPFLAPNREHPFSRRGEGRELKQPMSEKATNGVQVLSELGRRMTEDVRVNVKRADTPYLFPSRGRCAVDCTVCRGWMQRLHVVTRAVRMPPSERSGTAVPRFEVCRRKAQVNARGSGLRWTFYSCKRGASPSAARGRDATGWVAQGTCFPPRDPGPGVQRSLNDMSTRRAAVHVHVHVHVQHRLRFRLPSLPACQPRASPQLVRNRIENSPG